MDFVIKYSEATYWSNGKTILMVRTALSAFHSRRQNSRSESNNKLAFEYIYQDLINRTCQLVGVVNTTQ